MNYKKIVFSIPVLCSMLVVARIPEYVFPKDGPRAIYEATKSCFDRINKIQKEPVTINTLKDEAVVLEGFKRDLAIVLLQCQKTYISSLYGDAQEIAKNDGRDDLASVLVVTQEGAEAELQKQCDALIEKTEN